MSIEVHFLILYLAVKVKALCKILNNSNKVSQYTQTAKKSCNAMAIHILGLYPTENLALDKCNFVKWKIPLQILFSYFSLLYRSISHNNTID
jgi:hypothetical protein